MNARDTRYKAVKPREGPEYGPCMNAGYGRRTKKRKKEGMTKWQRIWKHY